MYNLTTKQRSGLIFSFIVFLFTVSIFVLFFISLQFILSYQLRHDLVKESVEALTEAISLNQGQIIFSKNDKGKSLRNHLISESLSAILFDANENALKKFGVFESAVLTNNQDDLKELRLLAENSKKNKNFAEKTINWNNEQFAVIITPIHSENKILGTLFIAKSVKANQNILYTIALIFSGFSLITLIGSFTLGYFLAERNLRPLKKIILATEEIDLDKLDKSILVSGSSKDEIVILARKFNQMLDRLRVMVQRQKDFISNASHELKTPLTRAVSTLDVLLSTRNSNKEDLLLVKSDLIGVNDLLEKLLFLSKIRAKTHIKKEQINIYFTYKKVLRKLTEEIVIKEIIIFENFDKTAEVLMDKQYFELVLTNLMVNAIKYSPIKSDIRISAFKYLDKTYFEIEDEGIGMDQTELKLIFSRFYRGGEARAKEHGHGIGLAIVKEICDLYNIRITVNSAKNKGTKITLEQSS